MQTTQTTPTTQTTQTGDPDIALFDQLDIRIGQVLSVVPHPDADSLYIEEIDVGEASPRTIVSGLRNHVTVNDFIGKYVLVLCNLPSRKMRGTLSNGMVLCACESTSSSESKVELLEPTSICTAGERVVISGHVTNVSTPLGVLKPKQKVWERCQVLLRSAASPMLPSVMPVACFKGNGLVAAISWASFMPKTLKDYVIE